MLLLALRTKAAEVLAGQAPSLSRHMDQAPSCVKWGQVPIVSGLARVEKRGVRVSVGGVVVIVVFLQLGSAGGHGVGWIPGRGPG